MKYLYSLNINTHTLHYKTNTMKFLYSLIVMAFAVLHQGNVQDVHAATLLGTFGTVEYEGTHGFPTKMPIVFESDYIVSDSPGEGEVYFTYSLSGSGASYYSSDSLTVIDAGPGTSLEFEIDLTKSASIPSIGVYAVSADVDMWQKNTTSGDILMHAKTYTVNVNLKGTEVIYVMDTAGNANAYTEQTDSSATNSDTLESVVPGDLALSQTGSTPGFGDDIVLEATTSNSDYKIWFDTSVTVDVYSDSGLSNKVYEWPAELINTDDSESGSSNTLEIALQSVPIGIFNMEDFYVQLGVKFRDTEGDRRLQSRTLQIGSTLFDTVADAASSHNDHVKRREGSAEFSAKITVGPSPLLLFRDNEKRSIPAYAAVWYVLILLVAIAMAIFGLYTLIRAWSQRRRRRCISSNQKKVGSKHNSDNRLRRDSIDETVLTFYDDDDDYDEENLCSFRAEF